MVTSEATPLTVRSSLVYSETNVMRMYPTTYSLLTSLLYSDLITRYLTGFALFLFLMIYRLKEMMMSLITIENRGAALLSQGDQSQKEYKRVSEEKDKFKAEAESAKLKMKTLEEEATKLRNSEKALKSQADNQGKECILSLNITSSPSHLTFSPHNHSQPTQTTRICAHVGVLSMTHLVSCRHHTIQSMSMQNQHHGASGLTKGSRTL